ncbi:hypothetical protein [Streptomyces sp. NPDC059003]|uniref:hypothetical protein n=1 Tax=Streptomyces sp. NPDC059003 TaxID=3346691 RepID=UPI00367B0026
MSDPLELEWQTGSGSKWDHWHVNFKSLNDITDPRKRADAMDATATELREQADLLNNKAAELREKGH